MEQPGLFNVDTPPVKKVKDRAPSTKPRWSKYRPTVPVRCDDCVTVLTMAQGNGPATRNARWRRRTTTSDLVLCYAHTRERRDEDGLPQLQDSDL